MPLKLNKTTGLFEDVPDLPSSFEIPSTPSTTVIPDPATDNINAKDETVLEHKSPVADPTHVIGHHNHVMTKKQELYLDIKNILAEHEGLESNIPVNHDYWKKLNEYRSIR